MVGFIVFPETRMLELLFKKRIESKVVLRKAVGFFEVEKVDQNCLKRVILLRVLVLFYKGAISIWTYFFNFKKSHSLPQNDF